MVCRSFLVPQKSSHPRETLLLSRLAELVEELSKSDLLDQRSYANSFADGVRNTTDLLFSQFRKHRQKGKLVSEISAIGNPLPTALGKTAGAENVKLF
jgi:hypothetical protein